MARSIASGKKTLFCKSYWGHLYRTFDCLVYRGKRYFINWQLTASRLVYFRNSKLEITVKLAAMFLDHRIPKVKLLQGEQGVTLLTSSVQLVTQRSLHTLLEVTGRPGNEHSSFVPFARNCSFISYSLFNPWCFGAN